jgi:hypothetical protein
LRCHPLLPCCFLQAIAKWLEGMLPYILILAAVFVYHFCTGTSQLQVLHIAWCVLQYACWPDQHL